MRWLTALIPFLLLGLALVYGMLAAFPTTDDVLWEYLLALHGPDSLEPGLKERPVSGILWGALAHTGSFWWPQIIGNFISWIALASISTWLFAWVFPDQRKIAIAAGLFVMSPLLLELHFIIACSYVPINALAQLPLVLLLKDYKTTAGWLTAVVIALLGLSAAALVSEYAVATAAGISVLLLAKAYFGTEVLQRRRDVIALLLLVATTIGSYGVFVSLRDDEFRSAVEGSFIVADGWYRFVKLPFRLASALYAATVGALLRELAAININLKETLLGVLFGLVVTGFSLLAMKNARRDESRFQRPFGGYEWPVLLAAFVAAILPALLMGRRPNDVTFESRFFFPALPMAALMSVAFVRQIFGARREWLVVAVFGFVAGYASLSEGLLAGRMNREIQSWGDAILPYLDENETTVAVVMIGKERFWDHTFEDDLLTSRISLHWPIKLRRKFYATNSLDEIGPSESSARRGAVIDYPVKRVLLVMPKGFGRGVTVSQIDKDHLPAGVLVQPQFQSPPPCTPRDLASDTRDEG